MKRLTAQRVASLGCWFAFAAVVSLVSVGVFAGPGPGPKKGDEFLGLWEGIDSLDGSPVRVSLTDVDGDDVLDVTLQEDFWTVCFDLGANYSQGRGVIVGTATVAGKGVLEVDAVLYCIDDSNNKDALDGDSDPIEWRLRSHGRILELPGFDDAPAIPLHRVAP